MNSCALLVAVFGALLSLATAGPAHAQATRTWVSGVGDDANPCSRTAPCKTFAGAISKTFINGEIDCLDPGGYGAVTITKSITIDCTFAQSTAILASGTSGVVINIPAGNANDPLRIVRLRGVGINGTGASGSVGTRTGIHGINILNAAAVFVEQSVITDFTQFGIRDNRSGGGTLFVKDTVIRNNGSSGIGIFAGGGVVKAEIDNSHLNLNNIGVGVSNAQQVMVSRSVISGNVSSGVALDSGGLVILDGNVISSNGTGINAPGGSTVLLSDNDLFLNATAISGSTNSYRTNRIQIGGAGTAPSQIGSPQTPTGLQ